MKWKEFFFVDMIFPKSSVCGSALDSREKIHLLILCSDVFGRRLVEFTGQLFERTFVHGEGPLAPKVVCNTSGQSYSLAGHFFIAQNGLLIIPEMSFLKKDDMAFLNKGNKSCECEKYGLINT